MDDMTSFNCKGLLLSHLMFIPHYILMFLMILIKFFQGKSNVFLKIFIVVLSCLFAAVILPVTFWLDFWLLTTVYSNMSFSEATEIAFRDIPLAPFVSLEKTN